jgi:hypothetical protein
MKIPEGVELSGETGDFQLGRSLTIVHISWND